MSGGVRKICQMTNITLLNDVSSMKYALKSFPGLPDVGVPHGDGDGPRTPPRCMEEVKKKFQMTNFIKPNNNSFIKDSLKPVPGLAHVGVLHGDGDGPRTPPRCPERVRKKFQMTNFIVPNNNSFMKNALKPVPGLADVGVLHGDGDGPNSGPRVRIKILHAPRCSG